MQTTIVKTQHGLRSLGVLAALLAVAGGALTSCSKQDELSGGGNAHSTEILAGASFVQLGVTPDVSAAQAAAGAKGQLCPGSPATRAVADPAQEMTFSLLRLDDIFLEDVGQGGLTPNSYENAEVLKATRAAGTGAQPLTFETTQYYLPSNLYCHFTGWWPAETDFWQGVATWELDGTQDIMILAETDGCAQTPFSAFAFEHRLSKLDFELAAVNAFSVQLWGTISAVNVLAQPTTCTYNAVNDAATGAVTTSGSTTYAVKNFASGALTATATLRGDAVFIAPSAGNVELLLEVVSSTRGKVAVKVPARSYLVGKAYRLSLTFKGAAVEVTVVPWNNVTTDDQVGTLKVGMFHDGGIVYEVTDATNYKVFSLDEGSGLTWSLDKTYILGAGDGQDATNGRKNVAAMKAYSNNTSGIFAMDFPAAAYCEAKNTGGVTGWYIPAIDELTELYTAYKANQTVLDAAITANSGTAMGNGPFWAGTENSNSLAWFVYFLNGKTGGAGKTATSSYVRCVKTPVPIEIGDVKDGGIVFWIDPANKRNYKVFSLDQGSNLSWAAQNYELGAGDGQDATDGRKNVAAMMDYSAAHTDDPDDTALTTGIFATDFPAAGFCEAKNTGGVKGWYLPAKDELTALYNAYKASQTVLDAAITANSGTAMASYDFWSGTEVSDSGLNAWSVDFSGTTYEAEKVICYFVRCIRAK